MNYKITVALVIAALLLVGCANGASVDAPPAINQADDANPVGVVFDNANNHNSAAAPVVELTPEEAVAAALQYVNLTEADVQELRVERDVENSVSVYNVEFHSGDYEYDIDVQVITGQILKQDKEYDPVKVQPTEPAPTEPAPTEPAPTEPAPTETAPTEPAPTEPAKQELTKEEAISAALKHAGLKKSQLSWVKAKRDMDDGVPQWEVEFRSGDYEYDYAIHAETGKVLKKDKDYDPVETQPVETTPVETQPAPTEPEKVELTKEDAIAVALKDAKVSEEDTIRMKAKREVDDGVPQWEIEFRSGDYEYDYTIHAESGKILDKDREYDPAATTPVETTPASPMSGDDALAIALDHAGLALDQIRGLEKELDKDDGKSEWELEFRVGKMEYSYTIDALSGKILDWEKETDD